MLFVLNIPYDASPDFSKQFWFPLQSEFVRELEKQLQYYSALGSHLKIASISGFPRKSCHSKTTNKLRHSVVFPERSLFPEAT